MFSRVSRYLVLLFFFASFHASGDMLGDRVTDNPWDVQMAPNPTPIQITRTNERPDISKIQDMLLKMPAKDLDRILPALSRMKQVVLEKRITLLLEEAERTLRIPGPRQEIAWQTLSNQLSILATENPDLAGLELARSMALAFIQRFPSRSLTPVLSSPSNEFKVSSGFPDPLQLVFEPAVFSNTFPIWKVTITALDTLRFNSEVTNSTVLYGADSRLALVISRASVDNTKNGLELNADYLAKPFLDALASVFKLENRTTIALQPNRLVLIARAEEQTMFEKYITAISRLGTNDQLAADKLTSDLSNLLAVAPDLAHLNDNKILVAGLTRLFPRGMCRLDVTEPNERLYITSGFSSPVNIKCMVDSRQAIGYYKPTFIASAGPGLLFANRERVISRNWPINAVILDLSVGIIAADEHSYNNHFSFSLKYPLYALFCMLYQSFPDDAPGLHLTKTHHLIAGRLSDSNSLYDSITGYRSYLTSTSRPANGIQSDAGLAVDGRFTFGGKLAGGSFDLLYGHPNGLYSDGIWSSFVSIKIDDIVYRFHELVKKRIYKRLDGSIIVEAYLPSAIGIITQIISPVVINNQASIKISYQIKNSSRKNYSFGVRMMLDTWAGMNDGVPFLIPGGDANKIFTHEVQFTPGWSPVWQTYELPVSKSMDAAGLCLQNITTGKGLTPPDRIAFASWPRAHQSDWDYYVDEDYRVTGDTAVILWWNPVSTAPGKEFHAATQFIVAKQHDGPMLYPTNPDNGQALLVLRYRNNSTRNASIKYTVTAINGQLLTTDATSLSATVATNTFFTKAIPLTCIGQGQVVVRVILNENGVQKNWDFKMDSNPANNVILSMPVVSAGSHLPVRYFLVGPIRQLYARLVSTEGNVFTTVPLRAIPWLNGHLYQGSIFISNSIRNRVVLEVVE